ncbi:MAG TPA: precorrin-3B C(17)-methyltransferase [Dissulfurispiraceae bacterium]|nr:precorrin-3B C(17)-methyltransferase [Dissulfurispiraceae bacterium]
MTTIFFITNAGKAVASRIEAALTDAETVRFDAELVRQQWQPGNKLVFIMAAGIVIRTIAPFIIDKKTDPAVVVLDENGQHVISLLSGHLGGANSLTQNIALLLDAVPVITTASDVAGLPALDLWARDNNLFIDNPDALSSAMIRLLNNRSLRIFADCDLRLPAVFERTTEQDSADVIVSVSDDIGNAGTAELPLMLRPKVLTVGIGCNSGAPEREIENSVRATLRIANIAFGSIRNVATIDLKAQEPGLVSFCRNHNFPLVTFPAARLNTVPNIGRSEAVFKATGAYAVAEPAAILASGVDWLLVDKHKYQNVTVAVARQEGFRSPGMLSIVGTGPGRAEHLTPAARTALREADTIVGYDTYIDMIRPLIADKEVLTTGMTGEVERCRAAIDLARKGKRVAVVSGGDPGIYAMAGLVFELLSADERKNGAPEEARPVSSPSSASSLPDFSSSGFSVSVVPGISALNAAAAVLGAPLMHDFCAISLSDRLTPWDVIERRLVAAAAADFVIVLYNPKSRSRTEHIEAAVALISRMQPATTPVGIVKAALRDGQQTIIATLGTISFEEIDMQTTVIIGNSKTFVWHGRMITPRGYEDKYDLA